MNIEEKLIVLWFFKELMNMYEFGICIDNSVKNEDEKIFKIIDGEKTYLGDADKDEFINLAQIIDRLDSHHKELIYDDINNRILEGTVIPKDDLGIIAKRFINSESVQKVLNEITPIWYEILINYSKNFEMKDIIEFLNKDEEFYKMVCQKYIDTKPNEMLIKNNNEILHIYIDYKYIKLKDDGLINKDNYKNYLNRNYGIYIYDYYKEYYENDVEYELKYDLENLEIINDSEEWVFYLSFDTLKKLNLGYGVQDYFPFIKADGIEEKYLNDFFQHFDIEQLKIFNESLYLYWNAGEIKYDEKLDELVSETYDFNKEIIKLSCGLIKYEDFINEYEVKEYVRENDIDIYINVFQYFKDKEVATLFEYGEDSNEGLYSLSELYKDLMEKSNIKYKVVYTEDISDGKYKTTIEFDDASITIETNAWNDYETVAENLISISEKYQELIKEQDEIEIEL